MAACMPLAYDRRNMEGSGTNCSLLLEDGSAFRGRSFGAVLPAGGEVVFTTGMVGYPESLTDPSYLGQILVFTYPLQGNYGVPAMGFEDGLPAGFESDRIRVAGVVVVEHGHHHSHHAAATSLSDWLESSGVPGISCVDTRAVTRRIRSLGSMPGAIVPDGMEPPAVPGDNGVRNPAAEVSCREPVLHGPPGGRRVVLADCGVKAGIVRALTGRGLSVLRVPWDHDFTAEDADGVVLSNGPGDPRTCTATIENTRRALTGDRPVLGICLGAQILALAAGASTYKLPYGHRGQNQACVETGSHRCYITSQNHGFAVDASTLPEDWREWFFNCNDGTNEGIIHISRPFFGAQFHPEASPGPDDTDFLFDMFTRALR